MPTHSLTYCIATRLQTLINLRKQAEAKFELVQRNVEEIETLVKNFMPSGSGFDNGTWLDFDRSTPSKLVFITSFHHMNDAGMYDGWTEHNVTLVAAFDGMEMKVSGRNRNDIKDYIADCFRGHAQTEILQEWDNVKKYFTFREVRETRAV